MRSALTALGVIIGVAAVIAMTGIGEGSKTAIQEDDRQHGREQPASVYARRGRQRRRELWQPAAARRSRPAMANRSSSSVRPSRPWPPSCNPAASWFTATTTGTRGSSSAAPPNTSTSAIGQDLEEGDIFTDRDVHNANKVCLIGTTLKRELFEGESPIGKEMRISNVAFRVIGVLSSKGANMVGMDQDDIVIAPWTTIKYRVNAGAEQRRAQRRSTDSNGVNTSVNSLSNLYPRRRLFTTRSPPTQVADTPQNIAFVTVDNIVVKAASTPQIPEAIREIKSLLRERHHIHTPNEDDDTHDDFNIRDNDGVDQQRWPRKRP